MTSYLQTVMREFLEGVNNLHDSVAELGVDLFIESNLDNAEAFAIGWLTHTPIEPEPTLKNIKNELEFLLSPNGDEYLEDEDVKIVQKLLNPNIFFECFLCEKIFKVDECHGVARVDNKGKQINLINVCDECFEVTHSHEISLMKDAEKQKPYLSDYIYLPNGEIKIRN